MFLVLCVVLFFVFVLVCFRPVFCVSNVADVSGLSIRFPLTFIMGCHVNVVLGSWLKL